MFAGNIPSNVVDVCSQKNVTCYDLMKMNQVALDNAVATAEGTVAEAIMLSAQNIAGHHCIILGYGRCAKELAKTIHGLSGLVTITARKATQLNEAVSDGYQTIPLSQMSTVLPQQDFIFNTIPARVLNEKEIQLIHKDAVIIDIASAPGGTDFAACESHGIPARLALGLPGKYSPKTSAEILYRAIISCEI